jgi:hypothetical protein
MIEFLDFIIKQKTGKIILFWLIIIPYTFWIIWFTGKNIISFINIIIHQIYKYKREIKYFIHKTKLYIWILYKNIYAALLVPFVIFCICIRWENIRRYINEITIIFIIISMPFIIFYVSIIGVMFSNLLDYCIRKMNVFAEDVKRSKRNKFTYISNLLLIPIAGFFSPLLIMAIPFVVIEKYAEWVKHFIGFFRKIKNKSQTITKPKKQLILYKYMALENWNYHRRHRRSRAYLDGRLYFADRNKLNDPAEFLPLLDRIASGSKTDSEITLYNKDPLDRYKICSMTADPGNFAMWTHYAGEHKGICIGYAIDFDMLKANKIKCEKVVYAKRIPVIKDFVYPYDNKLTWADIKKIIYFKMDDWKYEDEWRLVKKSKRPATWRIGKIVKIICGYKCTADDVKKLRDRLRIPVEQVTFERASNENVYLHVPGDDPDAFGHFSNEEWKYNIGSNGITILAYTGTKQEVNVPAIIREKPVVSIGKYAFSDREDLTSVTIPDGICKIEAFAFSNCSSLTSLTMPDNIKIGAGAFDGCSNIKNLNHG